MNFLLKLKLLQKKRLIDKEIYINYHNYYLVRFKLIEEHNRLKKKLYKLQSDGIITNIRLPKCMRYSERSKVNNLIISRKSIINALKSMKNL